MPEIPNRRCDRYESPGGDQGTVEGYGRGLL